MGNADPAHDSFAWKLRTLVGEDHVRCDEPLARHTTFCIGGAAQYFVEPTDADELRSVLALCKESNTPYFVLGCGSDLLISDKGLDGVVIAMTSDMVNVYLSDNKITCDAGVTLKELSELACEMSLSGLEFACGIPGSVGGACFMNAGAYGGQVADVLESVRVITPEGNFATYGLDELNFGYRQSRIAQDGLIVVSATFILSHDDREAIRERMADFTARREEKQPLELPSAGSTFKRPEGYFAGKLISDAGLQGFQVGQAQVSTKHAGFVVNLGGASADDVCAVVRHVQAEVKRQFDVDLFPELRFVGEFDELPAGVHEISLNK